MSFASSSPTARTTILSDAQLGLSLLFTDHAYSEILEQIFGLLELRDTARLLKVNKHTNQVFTSSSKLQLSYRRFYHAMPSPPPTKLTEDRRTTTTPYSEKLHRLLEKEERLESLKPTSIRCIHIPNSTLFELQAGYLLIGESMNKIRVNPADDKDGYMKDTFSIWKLSSNEDEQDQHSPERLRGGFKHQGYWRWRYNLGGGMYNMISMCVEDNIVAVVRELNEISCHSLPPDTNASTYVQIHFFRILPPKGTPTPPKGTFQGATRHPEAALSFIELRIPAKHHLHQMKLQLAPRGKVGLLLRPVHGADFGFLGIWDWKKGVSLGRIAPSPNLVLPNDFRFFGNFVIVSALRGVELPVKPKKSESKGKSNDSRNEDGSKQLGHTEKKMAKGYKVRGKTGPIPSRHDRHPDDDYGDSADEQRGSKTQIDAFFCLDTYELLDLSKGIKPSPFAHRAYTDIGYDPSEPCTWDHEVIPICESIVSFLPPSFNSLPECPLSPFGAILPGFAGPMVSPIACDLGEVHIDDVLLKGQRDGVITFTIEVSIAVPISGEDAYAQCQGTISLREIIRQITLTLTERNRLMGLKGDGIVGEKDLANLWSVDPSVQRALNRQLGLDSEAFLAELEEKGWETESEDEEHVPSGRRSKDKGKGKDKGKPPQKNKLPPSPSDLPFNVPISSASTSHNDRTGHSKGKAGDTPIKYIQYDQWEKSCSFRFVNLSKRPATFGSKVILAEPNYEKLKSMTGSSSDNSLTGEGPGFMPTKLILRDFNPNLVNKQDNLGSDKSSSDQVKIAPASEGSELKDTIMGECKLLKPIALPKFTSAVKRTNSTKDDRKVSTDLIFDVDHLESHLKFRQSEIEFMWDRKRKLLELLFDGDRLVMYMHNGATIMAFD
ncbi:hypothetical protein I302_106272 [Kwoniella bestiolae CBS 10118]|uniref:F-box domain-containing protein n=1 Tax=Kwoniella bestiolae CBS 10118 TaxID=1296100 RepID=A0A1B9G3I4_9TREE|nr:hypothetical protein I302_05396 [Kwoniella bestiolae CBS 10118]OCF25576.1 hypothetical protein I302_05396 [Kwoniella bestiolae CBS 10118]